MSNKRSKKLLATILTSAVITASLCACSSESSTTAVSDKNNVATEVTTNAPSELTQDTQTETATESLEAAFEKEFETQSTDNTDNTDNTGNTTVIENTSEEDKSTESDYSVCTNLDKKTVEAFASDVKSSILDNDWNKLASYVKYPIEIDGYSLTTEEDFINLINEKGISPDFISAIEAEPCKDLFARDIGIMMGNGEVWINQAIDTETSEPLDSLQITAFNGILAK